MEEGLDVDIVVDGEVEAADRDERDRAVDAKGDLPVLLHEIAHASGERHGLVEEEDREEI